MSNDEKITEVMQAYVDAVSGDVIRKIVKTSVDPYFEGVQFVQSAGSWDFSGGASDRFAFAAIRKGQPVISIMDTETGRTVQDTERFKFSTDQL